MNHFFNTNASDPARARTVGLANLLPAPFPTLISGGQTVHQFFAANDGVLESWSGAADRTIRVTVGDVQPAPVGGKFTLQVGSGTVNVVDADIDAAGLEYLLNADPTVTSEGGVWVFEQAPGRFLIAHKQLGGAAAMTISPARLVPDCTATQIVLATGSASIRQLVMLTISDVLPFQSTSFSPIVAPYTGWSGLIDLSSAAALELVRLKGEPRDGLIECETVLTVEVIDPSGNVATLLQTPITIRATNYPAAAPTTMQMQNFFTGPEVTGLVSNVSDATKLGGKTTATGYYPSGSTFQCLFTSDVVALFVRKNTTNAQSWPFTIRPYDYDPSSNPYQWVLDRVTKGGIPCTWDRNLNGGNGAFVYVEGYGNANAVGLAVDQTGFSLPA